MTLYNDFCDTGPDVKTNLLNNDLDFDAIKKEYEENKIVVVDNLLDVDVAKDLQQYMLNQTQFDTHYDGYNALDFFSNETTIRKILGLELQQKLGLEKYNRSWSFIYDNTSLGVNMHTDPSITTVNVWVTQDESMMLHSDYNGFIVHPVRAPDGWGNADDGSDRKSTVCRDYVKSKNATPHITKYKFNRATIFDSMFFHESQPIRTKEGHHNKRISYTWLFGEERE